MSSTFKQIIRKILRAVVEKMTEKWKKHLFGHLITYNPRLRLFSEKQSDSNNGPYCPLHSCKKLGRSLEPFWKKGQKSQKQLFWTQHLIPYNQGLRIFSEKLVSHLQDIILL